MADINALIAQGRPAPTWDYQESMKNALVNQGLQQQVQAFPEQQNWLRKKREMEVTDWTHEQEMQPLRDEETAIKYLYSIGPMINYKNYAQSREHLINVNGITEAALPPAESFPDEQSFETWKATALSSVAERMKRIELGMKGAELGIKERDVATKEERNRIEEIKANKPDKAKEYQPKMFVKPDGSFSWVQPGDPIPPGWMPVDNSMNLEVDSKTGPLDFQRGQGGKAGPWRP